MRTRTSSRAATGSAASATWKQALATAPLVNGHRRPGTGHPLAAEPRDRDKLYCVYVAPDADIIFEHARCGGFPATRVSQLSRVIDPSTADVPVTADVA